MMPVLRVRLVVGTRPEAVKTAPLVIALREAGVVEPVLVATGQHPTTVAQALDAFGAGPGGHAARRAVDAIAWLPGRSERPTPSDPSKVGAA